MSIRAQASFTYCRKIYIDAMANGLARRAGLNLRLGGGVGSASGSASGSRGLLALIGRGADGGTLLFRLGADAGVDAGAGTGAGAVAGVGGRALEIARARGGLVGSPSGSLRFLTGGAGG